MIGTTIKHLKKGDFFTLHPCEEAIERRVWVRGPFNRSTKRYDCYKFADVNHFHSFSSNLIVYTDFIF